MAIDKTSGAVFLPTSADRRPPVDDQTAETPVSSGASGSPSGWVAQSTATRWRTPNTLADDMDHVKRRRPPMPNDAATRVGLKVADAGIAVVNAVVFPIDDIRKNNALKEQARWDPAAEAQLSASRVSTNLSVAMALVPGVGRLGGLAKATAPLAREVALLVGGLTVKGGEAFEKQVLLKAAASAATTRTAKAAALGTTELAEAAKAVAPYWVKKVGGREVDLVSASLDKAGVKLTPEQLATFKKQVLEQYAVNKAAGKTGSFAVDDKLEAAVTQVAESRWGKANETSWFYAREFSAELSLTHALRPEQTLQLREVLKNLYVTTHEAASALGGPERAAQFRTLAERAADALFG